MAFTQSSLVNILFKKYITGKSQVSDSKQYFEEPINSRPNTFNSDIWLQSDQIPSVAATVSGVTTFVSVTMTYSSGTPGGFYDSTNTLVDIIPFNYGNGTSYQYGIFRNDGTTPIALGECDWLLDPNSGVLTFYTGASSGTVINPSTLATIASPSLPPVVKAWKYVGLKSVIPNLYGLTYSGGTMSISPSLFGTGLTYSGGVVSTTITAVAGPGLTASGNTFSVRLQTNSGLTVSSSGVALNPSSIGSGLTFSSGILSTTIQMYGSTYTFTAGTPQTFTHSLNSTDFIIQMYDSTTGDEVMAQYSNRTINTVDITVFDVVTARIVIIG
jgi:hypothetical protein